MTSLSRKRFATGLKRFALLCVGVTLAVTTLSAQTTNRVTLKGESITVSELFKEIERQTDLVVIVNTDNTDRTKSVTPTRREGTVSEFMDQALSGTDRTYRISGRYVVITPAKKDPEPIRQAALEEFNRNIDDHTSQYSVSVGTLPAAPATTVRYDTIRTDKPQDMVFQYSSRTMTPERSDRSVRTSFSQNTPPRIAIKTNLVWAATLTPNLAAEIGLGKKTSLELSGGNNRWNLDGSVGDNKKLVHWVIKPEFRYWLCERFNGHFFGVHALYGKYNVGDYDIPMLFDKEYRYEGDAYGGGISYGYHWAWSKHWGMEFTAGVGVARMSYVKKGCEKCGDEVGNYNKTYFGPTSLGIKLIFVIK